MPLWKGLVIRMESIEHDPLTQYRNAIDEVDSHLVELLEQRMDLVRQVADYKQQHGLPVLQSSREEAVLRRVTGLLHKKEYASAIEAFWKDLMRMSRKFQAARLDRPVTSSATCWTGERLPGQTIGFQGVAGSFSEEALFSYFGEDCPRRCYQQFEDVFHAIQTGEVEYGMLPIENSSTGAVSDVYDLLRHYGFYIVGEIGIPITQHLLGLPGSSLEQIREVYSHPQGIAQSSEFLRQLRDVKIIPFYNTAISAMEVRNQGDPTKAAIASRRAAAIYGLSILRESVQNNNENDTRFVVVRAKPEFAPDCDKISIVFSLDDRAGTLYHLLRCFAENQINMTKIESRPMEQGLWNYFLYIDFEGSLTERPVRDALNQLEQDADYFRLLGCYKRQLHKKIPFEEGTKKVQ